MSTILGQHISLVRPSACYIPKLTKAFKPRSIVRTKKAIIVQPEPNKVVRYTPPQYWMK